MSNVIKRIFSETVIQANPQKFKPCPCEQPGCTELVFDNELEEPLVRVDNVIYVDFVNKVIL